MTKPPFRRLWIVVRRAVGFFAFPLALAASVRADGPAPGFERFETILDRAPFGAPPAAAGADTTQAADATNGANPATVPPPPAPVRLQSVSRFQGVPAAGLVEKDSGRSFLLRVGETLGDYRLVDVVPEVGGAILASGTNLWTLTLDYAAGQARDLVPSTNPRFLSVHHPTNALPVHADTSATAIATATATAEPEDEESRRKAEDARLFEEATITDASGEKRISYKVLNRLRAELARKRAEEAREKALAVEAERRRLSQEAAERAAQARREAAEDEALEKEHDRILREELVDALASGEHVDVEMELTEEEAEKLEKAGFEL